MPFYADQTLSVERGLPRFSMDRFFPFEDGVLNVLDAEFPSELERLPVEGRYRVRGPEGRPDAVAFDIYQDPSLWWVVLAYNGIVEYEDLKIGAILLYPSRTDLEGLLTSLNQKQLRL